jgi:amino acid adenylation domain-containing protein
VDESFAWGVPNAPARQPGDPGRRIRRQAVLDAAVPSHAVAAALLAVLRKHSGHQRYEIALCDRGQLRCAMRADHTLAEHVGAVAAAIGRADGPVEPRGVAFAAFAADRPSGDTRPYDLVVHAVDGPSGSVVEVDAHAGVFSEPDAGRILDHIVRALRQILDTPTRTLADLDLLADGERERILFEFNATRCDYPRDSAIYPLFAEEVTARPEQAAVVHGDTILTYRQLDEGAATLASALAARGVGRGDRVALMFGKVPDWIVATLAVLRAGAAYVPIDPDFPAERRDFLLTDSAARVLIAPTAVPAPVEVIVPDFDADAGGAEAGAPAAAVATDGAYVMYTSGTTGNPKGVPINQRAVVRLVRNSSFAALTPQTRILQTGAVGFDATTFEIWGALLNGGTLILVPDETILDAAALSRAIARHRATTMWLTAPLFHQLVEQDPAVLRSIREVLVGGDVLSHPHIARAMRACPDLRVINGYGPTENTTFSTTHLLRDSPVDRIPIGTPVTNSTAYVVDLDDRLQPVGVAGELLVGGDGLSDGYLNRPDLEARRFVPDPFGSGGRLYRTGDLTRWRPDGTIDFLGRVDQQVKIRGFRVEPGEVENRLVALPMVREAAVLARTRPDGVEKYLCAYVTADRALAPHEVQAALRALVPEHLVPAVLVQVDAMPLNRNGKLDRAALAELPETVATPRTDRVGPRDDVEDALAALWQQALGVPAIGVTDNIFDLGVTSLTAAVFAGRARQRFGSWLTAADVLARPTVESLARLISGGGAQAAAPPLVAAQHRALFPLTPQQRNVYVEQAKDLTATHYNVPVLVETGEPVDRAGLQAAVDLLVARHDSLRTTFVQVGDATYQRIRDDVRVTVEELPGDSPDARRRFVRAFNLVDGPLLRVGVHQGRGSGLVLLDLHHLVADGIAVGVLLDELATAYAGAPLDNLTLGYRDYAVWRAERAADWIEERQRPFWTEALAGLATRPDLPTDHPRPALRATAGRRIEFDFGADRAAALRELGRRYGVTPFHALLAVHFLLLAQVTGADDVTVGTPVGGRTLPGTERIVGMFANTLCLRARLDDGQPFTDLLRRVGEHALGALRNQDYPFQRLVEDATASRGYSRNPLFDAMIGFQDATTFTDRSVLGGRAVAADTLNRHTMFDLNLQVYDTGRHWQGVWAYSTALFRAETVRAFTLHLLDLVDAVAAAPTTPVGELIGRGRTTNPGAGIEFDFAIANES